jgi:hypothetical protein
MSGISLGADIGGGKIVHFYKMAHVQNGARAADMSVSFVADAHVRKLPAYLQREHKFGVTEPWPGIYYVKGDLFAIQIIEGKRLEETAGGYG